MCEDVETLRKHAARVSVTLAPQVAEWTPPGAPLVEQSGDEWVLFYLDWSEALRAALVDDEAVNDVSLMPRDLEDVLVATVEAGRESR